MDRLLTSPLIRLLEIKLRGEDVTQIMKNCMESCWRQRQVGEVRWGKVVESCASSI